jgi:prepilin-type N-terminal cleavage/methylation domain-containing protein
MSRVPTHLRYRTRPSGYTAVEVLMAITVMSIGAAAVMSMQKASMQGNLDARKTDVANAIARTWVERIKRDAMEWTAPGPTTGTTPNLSSTAAIIQYGITNSGKWFLPNQYLALAGTPPLSPGFDILGRDLIAGDLGTALFCANARLVWLVINEMARVDVRVLWARGIANSPPTGGICNNTLATSDAPDPLVYHAIYVTTAVRGNPQ